MTTTLPDTLATRAATPAADLSRVAASARRRAWLCLVAAFVIWCSLIGSVLVTAWTYRRNATESPPAALAVERGTVFYGGSATSDQMRARPGMTAEEGGLIEVGDNGRATLDLFDGTTVRLLGNTKLELSQLRVGTFNADHTRLVLGLVEGAAHFNVAGKLPYSREVVLNTPHGRVSLSKGEYLVWVQEDGTRVSSYVGQAKAGSDDHAIRIRDSQRALLPTDGFPRGPFALSENLLRNGDFARQFLGWTMLDKGEPGRPDVGGTRRLVEETIAGRKMQALRISRNTDKDTHNETGVLQDINRDVSAYRTIAVTGWVKVDQASLSGGGYLGSEYPVMIRVQYVDEKGGRPGWTHGFYYANPELRPTENGEIVAQGEWYPFLSRLTDLPDRPILIRSIEILSAGHDFDAMVADVRIIAE
ncbi:MAG: FecR domain-containing protein [Chloroflexi bacterium]|nr:FecR domain-containing protein [Chloroflexota bacterium]